MRTLLKSKLMFFLVTVLFAGSLSAQDSNSISKTNDLNDGLIAHYPLDNSAEDASGNGNNGTNEGAIATEDRFGNANSAMEFDGTDYIDCGVDPISNNSSVTFTAWCKPYNTQSGYIISTGAQTSAVGYTSTFWNNQFYVGRKTETTYSTHSYFGDYPDNKWYFVAGVFDSLKNTLKIYVNDKLISTFEGNPHTYTKKYPSLFIGQANNGSGYFNGKIDDVRIYNYPLSKNEINELYYENGWEENETVTDIDGNIYRTVKIGDQTWMAENLRVTRYRNGDPIPNITDNSEWAGLSSGAYCAYDNNDSNIDIYGLLYNWYTVDDSRKIAPAGWHIPTDEEWKQLELTIGMSQEDVDITGWRGTDEGGKLKEVGYEHWSSPNTGANNESYFSALPSGNRWYNTGTFNDISYLASFWTATEASNSYAWHRLLYYTNSDVDRDDNPKRYGYSIRCVKDINSESFILKAKKDEFGATSNIEFDSKGTIFLANDVGGVFAYELADSVLTKKAHFMHGAYIHDISVYSDSIIYAASWSGQTGLFAYKYNGSFQIMGSIDDGGQAHSVEVGPDGTIFLANYYDIRAYTFNGSDFLNTATMQMPIGGVALDLAINNDGTIFLATGAAGLTAYEYNGSSFTQKANIDDGGEAWGVNLDDNGTVFLANSNDGLRAYSYNGSSFSNLAHINNGGSARNVTLNKNGTIFLANNYDGLRAYDFDGSTFFNTAHVDSSDDIAFGVNVREDGMIFSANWGDGFYVYEYSGFATDLKNKEVSQPLGFLLSQNYPNPFNPSTKINYELPITNYVELVVYNALGQKVKTIVNQKMSAGHHSVRFDGSSLSSGLYFYKISAGKFQQVKKMLLIK